ncbi:hypothetical protein BDV96DRAFT_627957 [Lophiotrema nucula]|uniref:Rhodopsin domain-containing protein n=1 Tax=Lophiotrema nucula TaxID=690887 RepID=A0A6A5ZS54_9PLEO|nr:hypothetical protein BDV96DRAFT_627957 [Lophiotrema nucula]
MASISQDITKAPPEVLAMLASMPAITPPNGTIPNFVDPYSKGPTQIIVTSIILGLVVIFFCNRAYVKLWLMKKLSWDDATILIAMLGSLAYYIACTWGVERGGIGKHQWDISVVQATKMDLLVPSWLIAVLTPLTFLFLKTTFFILYLSLFDQLRWARLCSWFGLVVTALTYSVLAICVFVFATPRRGETWFAHQTTPAEKRTLQLSVPQSIIGLIIDLYILLIPVIGVSGLKLSLKRKIGVILIFLSGTMACVCSACSIYYRVMLDNSKDTTYALIPVNISTLCEMFVGVICACMPSAAYAARQKNSMYQKVVATVSTFKTSWLTSENTDSQPQTEKNETHPTQDVLKSTDRKYAQYFSLDELATTTSSVDQKSSLGNDSLRSESVV